MRVMENERPSSPSGHTPPERTALSVPLAMLTVRVTSVGLPDSPNG